MGNSNGTFCYINSYRVVSVLYGRIRKIIVVQMGHFGCLYGSVGRGNVSFFSYSQN